jgi:GT2 family glycosyltransferase
MIMKPVMTHNGAAEWDGATWIGEVDESAISRAGAREKLRLASSQGYANARFLVKSGAGIRGFIDVPARAGLVDAIDMKRALTALPAAKVAPRPAELPSVTVIICTRDRATQLASALDSVLALDYPDFDVVIVDNAPATTETNDLVTALDDSRVTLVTENTPGISFARNTAIMAARGSIIAFTDDDVVVDRGWLHALVAGFTRDETIDLVSGLVPSGELRTPVQAYFDDRVSWSRNVAERVFSMDDQPADLPMFPFSIGEFGTGANFALRRDRALALGGFDTAFGVGSRTGGGEDLDMFMRVLLSGRKLAIEPTAIVWHRHRADISALARQARGYGTGLGAWITKIALHPRTRRMVIARGPEAARRLFSKGSGSTSATDPVLRAAIRRVGWLELLSVFIGPFAYLLQRMAGHGLLSAQLTRAPRRAPVMRPARVARESVLSRGRTAAGAVSAAVVSTRETVLSRSRSAVVTLIGSVRAAVSSALSTSSMSVKGASNRAGDLAQSTARSLDLSTLRAARAVRTRSARAVRAFRAVPVWERTAALAGLAGLIASPNVLPTPVQALLVGALVLLGPGAVVRMLVRMPRSTTAIVVPAVGITTVILATCALLAINAWSPQEMLGVLSFAIIAVALIPSTVRFMTSREGVLS